jgi:hypothetical protein
MIVFVFIPSIIGAAFDVVSETFDLELQERPTELI